MAITTYSELQTAIGNWLLRSDLTAVIPDFIALAEARMNRDSRLRVIDAITTGTLSISSKRTALPADFGRMVNIERQSTPVVALEYRTPQQMDAWRNQSATGETLYFCIVGDEIEVAPEPTEAVDHELIYYRRITALSNSNTTNWLLDAAPDVYLYACLSEASPYLHDDERVALWEQQYNARVDAYHESSEQDQTTDAPLVVSGPVIGG